MPRFSARAGIDAKADSPFVQTSIRRMAVALVEADISQEISARNRYAKPVTALVTADTLYDRYLGFPTSAEPVTVTAFTSEEDRSLVLNLPPNTQQIVELIQEQLANLELGGVGPIDYDDLPDPGSLIQYMTDYL